MLAQRLNLSPIHLGMLLATFGTALFSLKSIFIKLAYLEGLNTDSVLMLRMAISLPIYLGILLWLIRRQAHSAVQSSQLPMILLLGFLGYFLASWLDLKGLETITAQLERLTLFTYPILVALLGALFFKTPITAKVGLSLLITYGGLWVVFYQELQLIGDGTVFGTLMVFLAALSFSVYVLLGKRIIHQVGSLMFTSLAMISSSVITLIYFSVWVGFNGFEVTQMAWIWLILLALFSTVIPSFMIAEAIALIGPTQTGIVGTLGPIFTILLAVWWLNEPFGLPHLIGLSLVISGVLLLTFKRA